MFGFGKKAPLVPLTADELQAQIVATEAAQVEAAKRRAQDVVRRSIPLVDKALHALDNPRHEYKDFKGRARSVHLHASTRFGFNQGPDGLLLRVYDRFDGYGGDASEVLWNVYGTRGYYLTNCEERSSGSWLFGVYLREPKPGEHVL